MSTGQGSPVHSSSFVGASAAGEALGESVLVSVYIVGSTGFDVVSSGGTTTVGFGVFGICGFLMRKVSTIECGETVGLTSNGCLVGLGVAGFVKLGLGFPPPLGFGFAFPLGLGFDQIGCWVEGGADNCSKVTTDGGSVEVPTEGGSVTKIAGTEDTGELDGGGADEGGGEGSGSGQSLLQIVSSLQ